MRFEILFCVLVVTLLVDIFLCFEVLFFGYLARMWLVALFVGSRDSHLMVDALAFYYHSSTRFDYNRGSTGTPCNFNDWHFIRVITITEKEYLLH